MITPQTKANKLAKAIKLNADLYLKREDLHPCGSHKGRSIPPMIAKYLKEGKNNFCISSSGNAALAAAKFISETNRTTFRNKISLVIYVGQAIEPAKFEALLKYRGDNISIEQIKNPKKTAVTAQKNGLINLRQSTDDSALEGYGELAGELAEIKNLSAVFIPTSSGTTAQALYEAFKKIKLNPQIHIVQTSTCHPIADLIQGIPAKISSEKSLAGAIVDKIARRKQKVADAVNKSRGGAWIANNDKIQNAMNLTKKYEAVEISANSALSVAGLVQAIKNGREFNGPIVCLITGM